MSEFKNGKFINYTSKADSKRNHVRAICEDAEEVFWIGTYDEGLSRFKDGRFVNYKAENGLYNNGFLPSKKMEAVLGGTDAEGALIIAEEALENIKKLQIPHSQSKTCDFLTISLGVAMFFAKFDLTESDLINAADKALYRAKENGRDQIYVFDNLSQNPVNADILDEDRLTLS